VQSLTISNSRDVVVDGTRSTNSELFHMVVLQSHGVTLQQVTVDAPEDSPNTDGIHRKCQSSGTVTYRSWIDHPKPSRLVLFRYARHRIRTS
jgi:polygalacturonase